MVSMLEDHLFNVSDDADRFWCPVFIVFQMDCLKVI
jgi:hypothetical protein